MPDTDYSNFNTLYTLFYRKSYLYTKSYIHNELAAEDIASEALIKLWNLLKEKEIEKPEALLLTILRNRSLDHLKHEQIKADALQTMATIGQRELDVRISTLQACDPEEIFSIEVQTIIATTLATLPKQTRLVFEMSRFENKTNKEIAEALGITIKGVEYHVAKALKPLRISLKDYLPLFYFFYFLK